MTFVYFHGVPGSHDEVAIAGVDPAQILPETSADPSQRLIGFSLGAHRALTYAARHGAKQVDLIAPAAPLALGDFLPAMAGASVFRAAQTNRLDRLTAVQGMMARTTPALLRTLMLAGAAPADRALFSDPDARRHLSALLHHSLNDHRAAYLAAVTAYVQDWSGLLRDLTCPVTLWHGTRDTWAPLAMSQALVDHMPNATLNTLPDMGHYSALAQILPALLDQS